uniref:Uncharacterized protein n=1 Tax=Glossina austeni TaxID=7395 RepID=A0A1A9VE74_GLOAU
MLVMIRLLGWPAGGEGFGGGGAPQRLRYPSYFRIANWYSGINVFEFILLLPPLQHRCWLATELRMPFFTLFGVTMRCQFALSDRFAATTLRYSHLHYPLWATKYTALFLVGRKKQSCKYPCLAPWRGMSLRILMRGVLEILQSKSLSPFAASRNSIQWSKERPGGRICAATGVIMPPPFAPKPVPKT